MPDTVLEVANLTKKYGAFTAVDGISFSVPRGRIVGFLGPNGAGKTTTIQVLLGMLLWQVIWIVQYSVTLGSFWNIWSRNLTNIFVTPIRLSEYIVAHTISGIMKALCVFILAAVLSIYAFNFNVLDVGAPALALIFLNFTLFAYAIGIALLGLIFRYGTRIQAAAWATVSFLQPLVAAFYPLSIMPPLLQHVAALFPATHVFEAARFALQQGEIERRLFTIALMENAAYCILCTLFFSYLYTRSRDIGQFERNEA